MEWAIKPPYTTASIKHLSEVKGWNWINVCWSERKNIFIWVPAPVSLRRVSIQDPWIQPGNCPVPMRFAASVPRVNSRDICTMNSSLPSEVRISTFSPLSSVSFLAYCDSTLAGDSVIHESFIFNLISESSDILETGRSKPQTGETLSKTSKITKNTGIVTSIIDLFWYILYSINRRHYEVI